LTLKNLILALSKQKALKSQRKEIIELNAYIVYCKWRFFSAGAIKIQMQEYNIVNEDLFKVKLS